MLEKIFKDLKIYKYVVSEIFVIIALFLGVSHLKMMVPAVTSMNVILTAAHVHLDAPIQMADIPADVELTRIKPGMGKL